LTIPPATSSGKRLRVKGHGVSGRDGEAGDLFAIVQIVLPEPLPKDMAQRISNLELGPTNPRKELKW
jgi:DnaJ-class molecular chaperone